MSSEPWTFARVIKHLYEKSKTGILQVIGADGEVRIHLDEGKVVNVENTEGDTWKLGDFLVESGTVESNDLVREGRRAAKMGVTVEAALVQRGVLTKDILKRFVELHVRETIFPLFHRSGITCHFQEEPPEPNDWMAPVPVPYFLKNAQRRTKAWPKLRQRIPHDEFVFDKVDVYIQTILGDTGVGLVTKDKEGNLSGSTDQVGGNERIVYYYVNGRKTVRQLAYASCLGEFETYVALTRLYDRGFIEVRSERGEGETRKKKRRLLPLAFRTLAYGLTTILLVVLALWRPGALQEPAGFFSVMSPSLDSHLQAHQRGRIEHALDASFLTSSRPYQYPETLDALVEAGLLEASDLSPPARDGTWEYETEGEPRRGFSLSGGL